VAAAELGPLEGNELVMTQELIAKMLGVRREGVTEGALKLQQAGLIQYARGHISVLDRDGLQNRSCECYGGGQKGVRQAASPEVCVTTTSTAKCSLPSVLDQHH